MKELQLNYIGIYNSTVCQEVFLNFEPRTEEIGEIMKDYS